MKTEYFVVITGNILEGITLTGPWDNFDDADLWGSENCHEYLVAVIQNPDED